MRPDSGSLDAPDPLALTRLLQRLTTLFDLSRDVVAELDRSLVAPQIADLSLNMQKARAQNEQASLDSTLNLSKAREDLRFRAQQPTLFDVA